MKQNNTSKNIKYDEYLEQELEEEILKNKVNNNDNKFNTLKSDINKNINKSDINLYNEINILQNKDVKINDIDLENENSTIRNNNSLNNSVIHYSENTDNTDDLNKNNLINYEHKHKDRKKEISDPEQLWNILLHNIRQYNQNADFNTIEKAYIFAKEAHKKQIRKSGDPYIVHPLHVAIILSENKADSTSIIAALLHDTVEDTGTTINDINKNFGSLVSEIVDGLTKTEKKYDELKSKNYSHEMFRKIMLAAAKDIRVLLIKLADRLHNMRTLKYLPLEKQKEKSYETLEIFSPISEKLGVWKIKSELEDLALKYTEPEIFQLIKQKVAAKKEHRDEITEKFVNEINQMLEKSHITARVFGRAKHFYSIYRKMKKKGKALEDFGDLIGIRVITDSIDKCYHILSILQTKYEIIKEEFDDYIANPKPNGYMSIQASFKKDDNVFEIQIRTNEMDLFAENGIAAHWRYKDSGKDVFFDNRIAFVRDILNAKKKDPKAEALLEKVRFNIMGRDIIVLTPKGDPIILEEGSTVVDFAYAVHSDVGDHCSKAEVNGNIVQLSHEVKSGDVIKILTQKNAHPSRQWLNFVKTSHAKSKIRKALGIPESGKKASGSKEVDIIEFIEIPQNYDKYVKHTAKCCEISFGIPIAAYHTVDKKFFIHAKTCEKLKEYPKSKIIELKWKDFKKRKSIIRVITNEKLGILTDLIKVFTSNNVIIESINTEPRKGRIVFDFEVNGFVEESKARKVFSSVEGIIEVFVDYDR